VNENPEAPANGACWVEFAEGNGLALKTAEKTEFLKALADVYALKTFAAKVAPPTGGIERHSRPRDIESSTSATGR